MSYYEKRNRMFSENLFGREEENEWIDDDVAEEGGTSVWHINGDCVCCDEDSDAELLVKTLNKYRVKYELDKDDSIAGIVEKMLLNSWSYQQILAILEKMKACDYK